MKKFYVLWTYIGNYSLLLEVCADDAQGALEASDWGGQFHDKAIVYVFDTPPALIQYKGEVFPRTGKKDDAHVAAYRTAARVHAGAGPATYRPGGV